MSAESEPVAAAPEKKLDTRNFHEVKAAGDKIFTELIDLCTSHAARFFGSTNSGYAKQYGLPADAPKKRQYTALKKNIRALWKEFVRKYNSVTTTDRRDAEGKPMPKRTGMSRIVRCSPALTKFLNLGEWNLLAEGFPGEGYCTHGKVTCRLTDYVKLHCLQTPDARFWAADEAIMTLFGQAQFDRKKINPKAIRFIDIQSLLSGTKDKVEFAGHLTSQKKGTLDPELEASIRHKCSDEAEDELGYAIFKVHEARTLMKLYTDKYIKSVKKRNAAQEHRPGQGITKRLEAVVTECEAEYAKAAAAVRKYCESYNFSISPKFPPPLVVPPTKAPKEKAPKDKVPRTTKAPAKGKKGVATTPTPAAAARAAAGKK
jgi:hypothetical protein